MTRAEIDRIADLLAAAGRRNVPVPISIWKEMQLTMATKSIGKATVKDGKLTPVRKGSKIQKVAARKKAARKVAGLKANRAAVKTRKAK